MTMMHAANALSDLTLCGLDADAVDIADYDTEIVVAKACGQTVCEVCHEAMCAEIGRSWLSDDASNSGGSE
jgi:hypothetical protein